MRHAGGEDARQVGLSRDDGLDWLYYLYEPFDAADFEPRPTGRPPLEWGAGLAVEWLRWRTLCTDSFLAAGATSARLTLAAGWDSPTFATLEGLPLLRERCRDRASSFRRWKSAAYPALRHASATRAVAAALEKIREELPPDTGVHLSVVSLTPPRLLISARRVDEGYTRIAAVVSAGLLRETASLRFAVHAMV